MSWYDRPDNRGPSLDEDLRSALGGADADFDYDSLVAGTKVRAGRIRRRRALAQGAVAAVLVPTLVGTGFLLNNRLSVQDGHENVAVASQTTVPDPAVTDGTKAVVTEEDVTTVEPTTEPEPTGQAAPQPTPTQPEVTEPEVTTPAVQEPVVAPTGEETTAPPTTEEPTAEPTADPTTDPAEPTTTEPGQDPEPAENAVAIPDVTPTGIPFLDALGPAQLDLESPRLVPLNDFSYGNLPESVQPEPAIGAHSGRQWMFFTEGNKIDQRTVSLTVTGWGDSQGAMSALRFGDQMGYSFRSTPGNLVSIELPWDDRATGLADSVLVGEPSPAGGWTTVGALVRQGDYLVGVTVRAATLEEASAAAQEIALAAAANVRDSGIPEATD